MLIAVEGVDGAGKTTFCNQLAEQIGGPVEILHKSQPTGTALEEYELPLQGYLPGCGRHIICDRLHLGEHIYGPIYRGRSVLDQISQWHIEAFLNSRGAILVHLVEDESVLRRRLKKRGEDFLQDEHLTRAIVRYDEVVAETDLQRVLRLSSGATDSLDLTLRAADYEEVSARAATLAGTYVGPTLPTVLLAGEKRGPKAPQYLTAFVPAQGTSGLYLLECLFDAGGIDLRGLGMANAVEDEAAFGEMWEVLEKPPIVALGAEANRALDRLEIPHGAVPHPQYVRRFFHHNRAWYVKQIRRAWDHQTNLIGEQP